MTVSLAIDAQLARIPYPVDLARKPWSAIVLAGSRPGIDPLSAHFGVESKALIPVGGEAMLSRVVRSLLEEPRVGRIYLLAQHIDAIMADPTMVWADGHTQIVPVRSGNGISTSILDAIARHQPGWPVLVTTADHALLTREIVSHFMDAADCCDLAVGLVSSEVIKASYPHSRRSWLRFRRGAYTGANLFALRSADTARALELWAAVEQKRGSLWRIAMRFGPWLLMRAALRTMPLYDAIAHAGLRLRLFAKPVVLPFAEAGIDVDKPSDHSLAEKIIEARRVAVP